MIKLPLAGVCVALLGSLPIACERKPAPTPTPAAAPNDPAVRTYTLRGRITALPNPPKSALEIHHEALPEYANEKGEVIGMDEMIMQFPYLAPGVSLEGLQPGDPIEAVMEMRFKGQPPFQLTRITKLPTDTPLKLGKIEGGG